MTGSRIVADLIRSLRRELMRAADPDKAPAMQAYMKSAMPYAGVQTPALRGICSSVFADCLFPDRDAWAIAVLTLWRSARYREERYAAIHLASRPDQSKHRTMRSLPVFEELIVTGAWWDYVDGIAGGPLRGMLERYPAAMKKRMLAWSVCDDIWKRRSAILCQLGRKEHTDLDLLYRAIGPSMGEREFFLRKAIGWALRDYAWTDPGEVARYVAANADRLNPLSRREALKNVAGKRARS